MAYGKRKKGGQRLMEMSRAGTKRKAARKKKTLAQAKANIAKGPVTRGSTKKKVKSTVGGRNKTALRTPKSAGRVAGRTARNFGVGAKNTRGSTKKSTTSSTKNKPTRTTTKQKPTAAGRNQTALRTPRGAGGVAKKKATPKSDAGKYMGPYSKRTTSAKKKTTAKRSGPAPLPKNIQGMARPTLSDLPGNILKGSAIAFPGSIAVRGIGKKAIESGLKTEAGKKLMKSLTNVFKRKSSTPGRRKPTKKEVEETKNVEQGYADFKKNAREASRKNARRRGG